MCELADPAGGGGEELAIVTFLRFILFFRFLQVWENNGKNNRLLSPFGVGPPRVWEILDPLLDCVWVVCK